MCTCGSDCRCDSQNTCGCDCNQPKLRLNGCGCSMSPRLNGTDLTILSGTSQNVQYRKNEGGSEIKNNGGTIAIISCVVLAAIFGYVTLADSKSAK